MIKAKELMNTNVITIGPGEDAHEAVRTMMLNSITGLSVLHEDGTPAGIITEKDVLTLLYDAHQGPSRVEDFMTTEVTCFGPEDSVADITECFRHNCFRRVPILSEGRLAGIVSRRDILRCINEFQQEDEVLRDSILEILY